MSETDLWFGTLTATVRVEDLPASRRVVAIELPADGQWRVCGAGTSNSSGVATLPITGLPTSRIYAVAIDDWGRPFVPGMTVAYGDVIRPTQFLGWMYQVTQPGVLPAAEPEWWNSMAGVPQPVGTAMMQAIRHYQPIAHGPVSDIEWEENEFDPFWDNVVVLLPMDEDGGAVAINEANSGPVVNLVSGATFSPSDSQFASLGSLSFNGDYARAILSENPIQQRESFTIEAWVKITGSNTLNRLQGLWSCNRDSSFGEFDLSIGASGGAVVLRRQSSAGPAFNITTDASTAPLNEWVHVAHTFDGNHQRVFINGTRVIEVADVYGVIPNDMGFVFGGSYIQRYQSNRNMLKGFMDEVRITKGVARYTEDFTPPTAPFPNVGPPL